MQQIQKQKRDEEEEEQQISKNKWHPTKKNKKKEVVNGALVVDVDASPDGRFRRMVLTVMPQSSPPL